MNICIYWYTTYIIFFKNFHLRAPMLAIGCTYGYEPIFILFHYLLALKNALIHPRNFKTAFSSPGQVAQGTSAYGPSNIKKWQGKKPNFFVFLDILLKLILNLDTYGGHILSKLQPDICKNKNSCNFFSDFWWFWKNIENFQCWPKC